MRHSARDVFGARKEPSAGEVGYITASIKNVREARVGDTITLADRPAAEPLPGYRAVQPMVFLWCVPGRRCTMQTLEMRSKIAAERRGADV